MHRKNYRQNHDSLTEEEQWSVQERLRRFDEERVPFPKTWHFADSTNQTPQRWEEFTPSSWQDIFQQISRQKEEKRVSSTLVSLHDFTVDLERMLESNPDLWAAFVQDGGECALSKSTGQSQSGGACYSSQHVVYYRNFDLQIQSTNSTKSMASLLLAAMAQRYPQNALAHEIGHAMDYQAHKLERSKEKFLGGALFMSSPLFQEAFSLDLYTSPNDPVTGQIFDNITAGGGLTGCNNSIPKAVAHAGAVRKGERRPGEYSTDDETKAALMVQEETTYQTLWESRDTINGLRNARRKKDPQLHLPYDDSEEIRLSVGAAQYAREWVAHRSADVHSTWLEAFARVVEIYYGTSDISIESLPYPSLSRFMSSCVSPTLEMLASDALDEDKTAKIATVGRLLHRPLQTMMTQADYERYAEIRERMGNQPMSDTSESMEAKEILVRTINRVASEIKLTQRHQPSQRSLF